MGRGDLSDAEWNGLRPLLPVSKGRCGRWRDHRQVIDGILYGVRTGVQWPDVPERCGPWKTVYERHRLWSADGTWERLLKQVQAAADAAGDLDWVVAVDSTIVCAHQHAAGGPPRGAAASEPDDHALGRSRGGLTTKINLAADTRCRPLAFVLTPGQAGDAPTFPEVMARLRALRPVGRPRTTPDVVLADKAYSSRTIRAHLRQCGIRAVIPQPADQIAKRKKRGRAGGRPPAFDREQWHGVATQNEKTAAICLAGLHIAGIFIWSDR
ncbi:IS5 family transposase [Streptomyces sp. NPDC056202]|uniref:IS5 family transposase n=1 Tax=Streptomyces sp. NPDC056202 TaxID=3345745 RepID=UPI0035DC9C5B